MVDTTAIDQSAVARVVGVETIFVPRAGGAQLLPQVVGLVGQGRSDSVYSLDKRRVLSAFEVGQVYGFGSPLHLAAKELLPEFGGGLRTIPLIIHPLEDAVGSQAAIFEVAGVGAQTVDQAFKILVNGIPSASFVIAAGETLAANAADAVSAVSANVDMPVSAAVNAGAVQLTAVWKGISGNQLVVEVVGETDDIVFSVTQTQVGLINPDVDDALAKVGSVWETMLLNCLNYDDTATLEKFRVWGESRWLPTVKMPVLAFVGNTEIGFASITAVTDARKTDRINCQLSAPGSNNLPFVVAAAQLAEIAYQANNNPPVDYGSIPVESINPGDDIDQNEYSARDAIVKAGASTVTVRDGVVTLEDIVTMFHPTGKPNPEWRYVVDVVKEMNVTYNVRLIFETREWDGAPLVPNSQRVTNPKAKQPKDAVTALANLSDDLGDEAILSDPDGTKPFIQADIGKNNPKRLDVVFPHNISGNANIISVDSKFSFFYGN